MKATSHLPDFAASATAPGLGNGTSSTGTPSRLPSSVPRSAAMPFGLPVALSVAVSRKLLMLRPTCSVPVGASALRASVMSVMAAPAKWERRMLTPARWTCPHPGLRCRLARSPAGSAGVESREVDRRQLRRDALPAVAPVFGYPYAAGGRADHQALAGCVDVEAVAVDEVVGMFLGQSLAQHRERLAAVAGASDHQLRVHRDAAFV